MPTVATSNHINDLISVLIDFQKRTNKKVTYEYLLMENINDQPKHAKELAKLLKNQIVLVNLIRFNSSPGISFKPSKKSAIETFQNILDSRNINNTLRHSYGNDISAACGQLANIKPN
jgi:23S rRNA (adenine2503-C2)-methyltransferase